MRKVTKAQVLVWFKELYRPTSDRIANAEAWNNYTDTLCKDGTISAHQYRTWLTHTK